MAQRSSIAPHEIIRGVGRPKVTKDIAANAPYFNPSRGQHHIRDLWRNDKIIGSSLGDEMCGAIWLAVKDGALRKIDGVDFRMAFITGLRMRKWRLHSGHPFLGPDGLVLDLDEIEGIKGMDGEESFGGLMVGGVRTVQTQPSPLKTITQLRNHPRFGQWRSELLYRGGDKGNSLNSALDGLVQFTPPPPGLPGLPTPKHGYEEPPSRAKKAMSRRLKLTKTQRTRESLKLRRRE